MAALRYLAGRENSAEPVPVGAGGGSGGAPDG
jgi:hypothetical protein